jgi:hypothetical protein
LGCQPVMTCAGTIERYVTLAMTYHLSVGWLRLIA